MFTTPTPLCDPTPSSRFAVISNGGSDWLLYDRLAGQECVVCSTPNYSLVQRAAIRLREGDPATAGALEGNCETIYARLPAWARW